MVNLTSLIKKEQQLRQEKLILLRAGTLGSKTFGELLPALQTNTKIAQKLPNKYCTTFTSLLGTNHFEPASPSVLLLKIWGTLFTMQHVPNAEL